MKKFSIVIPAYNEEAILEKSLLSLISKLKTEFPPNTYEILLIENGSQDQTLAIAKSLALKFKFFQVFHLSKPSYGGALRKGILEAKNENLVIFNVDFWDISFLKKALKLLANADIVIGSKTLIASHDLRPLHRRLLTHFFNVALKILFNFPGSDTHGIKVFKKKKFVPLMKKCQAYHELFDTELILRASKKGLVLTELPIKVREIRPTRYNNLKRGINTLKDLILIFRAKLLNEK